MTLRTRAAVRSSRSLLTLRTRETVVLLTPALAATSAIVTRTHSPFLTRQGSGGVDREATAVPVPEPVPEPVPTYIGARRAEGQSRGDNVPVSVSGRPK